MVKLRIKNFGPIKEIYKDEYLIINKVSVFIGEQGSGKSTIAKLFSTLSWLEKDFFRTPQNASNFGREEFIQYCANQKLSDYFIDSTRIDYIGGAYEFHYSKDKFTYSPISGRYNKPKIMYIPSERNLLTVVDKAENVKKLPLMLRLLQTEYKNALSASETGIFKLPVGDFKLLFNKETQITTIKNEESSVRIQESSSGLQSLVPISIVSNYLLQDVNKTLVEIIQELSSFDIEKIKELIEKKWDDVIISDHLINVFEHDFTYGTINHVNETDYNMIKEVILDYVNTCFVNIVEEPEQNLFPVSQVNVLEELISINNSIKENKLLITTHSPYILSALNNYIYACAVNKRTGKEISEISKKLFVDINDTSAYRIQNGIVHNIINKDYELIDTTEIDDCFSVINSLYDKLVEVDNE